MKLNSKVRLLITCDSSAGAGKTTAAKYLSKRLGLSLLTSGLLYRYVAYKLMFSKRKVRYDDSSTKIITGYPDAECEDDIKIQKKIVEYGEKYSNHYSKDTIYQGVGSKKSKTTVNKTNPVIQSDKSPVFSEPVIVNWNETKDKPETWYREPIKRNDLQESKIIYPSYPW